MDNYKQLHDSADQINQKLARDPGQDSDIAKLSGQIKAIGDSLESTDKKVEDLASDFNDLGFEINTVILPELLSEPITQESLGNDSTFQPIYFRNINPEVSYSVVFNNTVTNMATPQSTSFLQVIRHNDGKRYQVYTWAYGQMYEVGKEYPMPPCETIEIVAKWGKTETMSVSIVRKGLNKKIEDLQNNKQDNLTPSQLDSVNSGISKEVLHNLSEDIKSIKENLGGSGIEYLSFPNIGNGYLDLDCVLRAASNCSTSDALKVSKGTKVVVETQGVNMTCIAFSEDGVKYYAKEISENDSGFVRKEFVAPTDGYVKVCTRNVAITNQKPYVLLGSERLNDIESINEYQEKGEYIRVYTDNKNRLLWWIDRDGNIGWSKGIPKPIAEELAKLQNLGNTTESRVSAIEPFLEELPTYEENPEFASVCVDKNRRIIWWVDRDGNFNWSKGVPEPIKEALNGKANKEDGFQIIESEEFASALVDKEKRIISAIRKDGEVIHYTPHRFDKLALTDKGMSDFIKAMKKSGFSGGAGDWSDEKLLELPIPRKCALVNIIADRLPTSKQDNIKATMQFWDMDGNYFQKPIIINAQGNSSMSFIEKNISFDLDDKSTIKFGNWVAQDSFHLKAYWVDVFRGICNVAYNWTNSLIEYLNCRSNRILHNPEVTKLMASGNFADDWGSDARCQPDGFPIEIYFNGEYHGLFAFNLKKHRANYEMDKSNYSQALLDGLIDSSTFFNASINWTQFELKNPKTLYCMDGTKYDGDAPKEIIDETSSSYDATNNDHRNTAALKAKIKRISDVIPTLKATSNIDEAKTIFEAYFDKQMTMLYFIGSNVLSHFDGFAKNWIWTIYDTIASPNFYDMDSIFGRSWTGAYITESYTTTIFGSSSSLPTGQLWRLYKEEVKSLYAELRRNGMISVDYIMSFVYDWTNRVGRDAYKRNIDKWAMIPSYRADGGNYPVPYSVTDTVNRGMFDSPERVRTWLVSRLQYLDSYFNYNS